MKTEHSAFELETPRDRNGNFEPEIVKKNQTHMSDEIEKKMLSLFSLGSSYSQITDHIQEIYGVHFSKPAIAAVTDKLIPLLQEWKKRPLESIYPFIYLDAIHYKVREEGHYVSKAFYTVLGVTLEGKKEILGLALKEKGFETEQTLESGLLSDEERINLQAQCDTLTQKLKEAKALRIEVEEKLEALSEKDIPKKDLSDLMREKNEQEENFGHLSRVFGELESKLTIDSQNREKQQVKLDELSEHNKSQNVLEKLYELIGASDGTKFSKFAQGITLDHLIYLANRHLVLLSDRYAIVRKKEEAQQLEKVPVAYP